MDKRIARTSLAVLASVLATGCASAKWMVYEPKLIQSVRNWEVTFIYESQEIGQKVSTPGEAEVSFVRKGQDRRDLQLRDDIVFILKDNYSLSASRPPVPGAGQISLHAIHFPSGHFKSVNVEFCNPEDKLLARIRVQNGDRPATMKDDYDFAVFTAAAIADVLKIRKNR